MGFYAPATIVEDAKRHDVIVRPVDVQVSEWDCTLEFCEECSCGFAVRMGLRYVKGLGEADWESIARGRHSMPFISVDDFVPRTTLDEGVLSTLAEAGAFDGLDVTGVRRSGTCAGLPVQGKNHFHFPARESTPLFESLSAFEEVKWDYHTTSHSPRRHPLAPMRASLTQQRLPDARKVASMKNGQKVRYAGLVICRQRPGTAGGVVFMTLEDETGFVNVVVWESVFQQYSVLAKTVSFLGITGTLQAEDSVVHLVAEKLWEPKMGLKPTGAPSRDFH